MLFWEAKALADTGLVISQAKEYVVSSICFLVIVIVVMEDWWTHCSEDHSDTTIAAVLFLSYDIMHYT